MDVDRVEVALYGLQLPREQRTAVFSCLAELREAPSGGSGLAAALFNLGAELSSALADAGAHTAGIVELAIELLEASISLEPDDADAHYNLGLCYDAIGPSGAESAVGSYRRSAELRPSPDAYTNLGIALKACGNVADSAAAHSAAFALDSSLPEIYAVRLLGLEEGGAFGTGAVATPALALDEQWRDRLHAAATVLRADGYGNRSAMIEVLGLSDSPRYWPTGEDYFAMRLDAAVRARLCEGQTALQVLVRLFLLGCAVPRTEANEKLGEEVLDTLLNCGLLLPSCGVADCLNSPVQIYPLYPIVHVPDEHARAEERRKSGSTRHYNTDDSSIHSDALGICDSLLLATDFPIDTLLPGKNSVMAIGTDSLELVRHPPRPGETSGDIRETAEECGERRWLDLCCGSGVQGLSAVAWKRCDHATCIDINPRAVHFTLCNAMLNFIPIELYNDHYDDDKRVLSSSGDSRRGRVTVLQGDLYEPLDRHTASVDRFEAVLANPPFVAVPERLADLPLHSAWALFAAGGPTGDEVLRRIVKGAGDYLHKRQAGGWLAIVTEFPNIKQTGAWLASLLDDTGAAEGESSDDGWWWDSTVIFQASDVVCAADYSALRAAERGWQGGQVTAAWRRGMKENGVNDMCSGLFYGAISGSCTVDGSDTFSLARGRDKVRLGLREYAGDDRDFMVGAGAEFVATKLDQLASRQQV